MEATSQALGEPIVMSHITPTPIRFLFGGMGVALAILLLVELGPALWPPSFLTLFLGIFLLVGLVVNLTVAAAAALGPDLTWEIRPGRLTITYQLLNQTSVKIYELGDLDGCEVMTSSWDSRVDTYHLVCRLPLGRTFKTGLESTPFLMAILAFLRAPLATSSGVPYAETRLRSPNFSKREEAERALAHLLAR
jgi:hypothetical protein